jgi:hypothetical protein
MSNLSNTVLDLLSTLPIKHLDNLKQLFWTELNYERVDEPLSTRNWQPILKQRLVEQPIVFAAAGDRNTFRVIYCHLAGDRFLSSPCSAWGCRSRRSASLSSSLWAAIRAATQSVSPLRR